MHPSRSTVPKRMSVATARIRSDRLAIETAKIVPCTRAIMVASVSAAAPITAVTQAKILLVTWRLRRGRSLGESIEGGKIMHEGLVNAGPVVGHEDRIAGVRRVILHARGLACGKALQAKPLFQTRDVLGGFVGDAGNRVAVSNQTTHAICGPAWQRAFALGEHGDAGFLSGGCRCFHKLNDKAFHDSAHLIELKTAAALLVFRILWFLKVTMQNHSRCSDDQRRDSDDDPPIDSQLVQRLGLRAEAGSNTSPSVSRAFSQSFRNPSSPRSVNGCLKSCSNTFEGMVPMCAPMRAAATTCNGCRRLAASTCVE